MTYLRTGHARYPVRIGHEWCGTVAAVGPGVDATWVGRRVTGDTMLGCGRCARCTAGRHHVCTDRFEVGIRGGWPGALAEQVRMPVNALHVLPAQVDLTAGALVEPGGNALRAVESAAVGAGERLLVWGPGTIGLLAAQFALARGAEVHVVGPSEPALMLAKELGVQGTWAPDAVPPMPFHGVIDATNGPDVPARALAMVEPGRRVVYIGIAAEATRIDTRDLVLNDVTAVGVLSGSAGLPGAIADYASGAVDPAPLVAATVSLDEVAAVFTGWRPPGAGPGPKVHVDPRV
jgi:threonine dehydrogenase-like Zn-dependent dehydrogenase